MGEVGIDRRKHGSRIGNGADVRQKVDSGLEGAGEETGAGYVSSQKEHRL